MCNVLSAGCQFSFWKKKQLNIQIPQAKVFFIQLFIAQTCHCLCC